MAEEYTPETIEDCIVILDKIVSDEEKAAIKNVKQSEFTMNAHFGLGMWIRNNFGAWNADGPLTKNTGLSGDELSGDILEAFYKHLTA